MKNLVVATLIAAFLVTGMGCEVVDPLIIAVGLPLEVSEDLNGGNSWDETDTFVIEDEISEVDVSYLDDVKASRVNDITVYLDNPPATGTSTGVLIYAIDGGLPDTLATWTDVPFTSMPEPGVSILDATVLTVNPAARADILARLQDTTGLPLASSIMIQTSGTTSVNVAAGTKIVARFQYQVDIEI